MSASFSSQNKDIILVHSSDIHIDDGYTARANEGDGTKPLLEVIKTAEKVRADILLLVGDIFEHNRLANEIIKKAFTSKITPFKPGKNEKISLPRKDDEPKESPLRH